MLQSFHILVIATEMVTVITFLSLYKNDVFKLVNSNFYIALLLIQLFYIKISNKTSTSAKNFCRSWSKKLWSNWKASVEKKIDLALILHCCAPTGAIRISSFSYVCSCFCWNLCYDQFWGLSWSCWMLRQWPVGAKHSGIGKFIWVSSLRYLEFLFMKLRVILPVCFPRIQLPSRNRPSSMLSWETSYMPTSEGSQGYLVVTERRKNDRSVTLYAVSGTHCGNWLMITRRNRSSSFGILTSVAFHSGENDLWNPL